jgi:tRNA-dihydrouridine synthase 3
MKEGEKEKVADSSDAVMKKEDDVEMTEANKEEKAPLSAPTTTPTPAPTQIKTPIDMSPLPKTRKIIDFSNKVYIAPLTTVGNLPFRRIMKKFSADITCGEMAVANNLLQAKAGEWALLKRHPDEDIFGVQIAAGHADVYTRISEVIENEGLDIDFLDMNLGCPIDVLCNQGCGAKLMLRENKLRDSLKGMLGTLSIPITIKIRTGWEEKKPFAHRLVPKIQRWANDAGGGVATVMVHGRSRLQRYSKLANWDYIQQVSAAQSDDIPKIPIVGNGDIFSYTDYEKNVLKNDGISTTAMLGRGALIKPWLPTEIKEKRHWDISATERLDFLKDFVKFGLEHWGSDQHGVDTTRRFLLEWLSFLYRYVPVGLLEVVPQSMNQRPPTFMCGRNDLETLMLSKNSKDWVKISELLLGKVPDGFEFEAKHKANSYK